MEEAPKDHDFDQRRDGPEQEDHRPSIPAGTSTGPRPSVQYAPETKRPQAKGSKSDPMNVNRTTSNPEVSQHSASIAHGRRSMQHDRTEDPEMGVGRSNTARSGRGRPSVDFDIRRDGPYGRPSITMERPRRKSSGFAAGSHPQLPAIPATPAPHSDETAILSSDDDNREPEETPPSYPSNPEPFNSSTDPAFQPEPPPINYSLWVRKWSITFWWSMILFDSIVMPIALYFGLWYGLTREQMSANTVFSIVTAALGGASIFEYFLRFWALWKKGSTCRVIGARRMYFDWFHWNFTGAWLIIMLELIIGSVQEDPFIRLLSMPLATMLYVFGTELLIVDIARYYHYPAPCRISSIPKGAQLRPAIYSLIEDVCAVDGGGNTIFREELNARYEASHTFRAMLRCLGVFWSTGAETCAVLTTIIVFTTSEDVAYTVGWSLPFVWAGIWTWATIWYVRRCLIKEKVAWAEEVAAKSQA